MSAALGKGLVALVPVCMLLCGSALFFRREGTARAFLQFLGAGCMVSSSSHTSAKPRIFFRQCAGERRAVPDTNDLFSAVFALILFPTGLFAAGIRDPKTYRRGAVNGIIQP